MTFSLEKRFKIELKGTVHERNNWKLDFSKRFLSETNNGKRVKKQAKQWEKYFQKTQLIKDCYSKYTKPVKCQIITKQTHQLKQVKDLNRYPNKENLQMAN